MLNLAKLCDACDRPGHYLCARCKLTSYCSKDCQKNNWPAHKAVCTSTPPALFAAAPPDAGIRAIARENLKNIVGNVIIFVAHNVYGGRRTSNAAGGEISQTSPANAAAWCVDVTVAATAEQYALSSVFYYKLSLGRKHPGENHILCLNLSDISLNFGVEDLNIVLPSVWQKITGRFPDPGPEWTVLVR